MDIVKYFEDLRWDQNHHMGLGDIRLTMSQQEEIIEYVTDLEYELTYQDGMKDR